MSHARYAAQVGVPLLLEMLKREGLRTTFFVPLWTAQHHPDVIRAITGSGHEIGCHGDRHERLTELSLDQERDILRRSLDGLEALSGMRPVGYRAPYWKLSAHTLDLLREHGFRYSSNMMDHIVPYIHAGGPGDPLVELPVHWILDDAPFFNYPNRPIRSPREVLEIWNAEFLGLRARGGLCIVTCHPQLSARPSRVDMVRELVRFVRGHADVWCATLAEVADYWRSIGGGADRAMVVMA